MPKAVWGTVLTLLSVLSELSSSYFSFFSVPNPCRLCNVVSPHQRAKKYLWLRPILHPLASLPSKKYDERTKEAQREWGEMRQLFLCRVMWSCVRLHWRRQMTAAGRISWSQQGQPLCFDNWWYTLRGGPPVCERLWRWMRSWLLSDDHSFFLATTRSTVFPRPSSTFL